MRGRVGTERGADGEAGEQDGLPFFDAIGIAQPQWRQCITADAEHGEIGAVIDGHLFRFAKEDLAIRARGENAEELEAGCIECAGQHMRVGRNQRAVADHESRASELERGRTRALVSADSDDRGLDSADGGGRVLGIRVEGDRAQRAPWSVKGP